MILEIAEGRVLSMETSSAGQRNHRVERVVEPPKRFWGQASQTTRVAAASPELQSALESAAGTEQSPEELRQRLVPRRTQ
jgi:hypothetical protein